ncbi:uncharacterized protein BT62DRAFT_1012986 [Guyanagaster necrorhizus]|uniref:DUF2421 domain-containing protein n=1 Tax=Guyanagaster necrorhizus TaxID=856835 RepID=A0A9P7VGN4_9AGAR|nr:uncharacterized protein BT62DRAFT_1012986 [Guyanagaster necrorhizus MCA 3950]KAG7440200.1 hypothetical protein BT62DRAFT_1012986 [Guyanagaster necrorhizus MCA 3950]
MARAVKISPSTQSFASDRKQQHDASPVPPVPPVPPLKARPPPSLWSYLPTWVSKNLRSKRSLKILFRSCVACWLAYVIMLPNASLRTLGTAGFFGLLTSLFVPAYIPVQLFFFIMTTVEVGLLLGWGIGAAAMRAANESRDPSVLQASMAVLNASIAANPAFQANPTLATTTAIYHGVFLDTRASVVYGCFLGLGAFIMGLFRAYAPTLIFLSIFGTIAMDIFATYGPLFPTAHYHLMNSMAISVSCYMAIAILTTIFIFPESMNHSLINDVLEQLDRLKDMVETQDEVLRTPPEHLVSEQSPLIKETKVARATIVLSQQQLMATSRFIHLEFSHGRWNGDDVLDLLEPLLTLVTQVAGLQSFSQLICMSQHLFERFRSDSTTTIPDTSDGYLLRRYHERNETIEAEHKVHVSEVLPIIDRSTGPLRQAISNGIETTKRSLNHINQCRWSRNADMDAQMRVGLDKAIEELQSSLGEFKKTNRLALINPFRPILNNRELTQGSQTLPLRSLYVSYVFATTMINVGEASLGLMTLVSDTMEKRKANRLWAPKGLRKLWKILSARGDQTNAVLGDDVSPHATGRHVEEHEVDHRRDPDSRPPTNAFQRVMHRISAVYRWTLTPEAIFAFKYIFISIALWIPCVVRSSAFFFYREKGIWALIMAQTVINLYAADQIFNLVTRLIGTFGGLVAGLLAWYLGNANSHGSVYGSAAAVGFVLIPIVFVRLFSPVKYLQGVVLGCATFALVVGYSWIDGHLTQLATPGQGWSVAWRRWVLVVIGSGASFVVMMLPPTSGRKAVRLRNASSISSLSNLYGHLISTWISEVGPDEEKVERGEEQAKTRWVKEFREKVMGASSEMRTIRELTELAMWEGSLRGKWPKEEYVQLVEVQIEMVSSLWQLGAALMQLDDAWRVTFLHHTGVLNPNFISDVMGLFSLVSQSLRTAEPMHQVLPETLLEKLFYHQSNYAIRDSLTLESATSLDYMYYAAGVVAVYQLLHSLDELHRITKTLCGEVPLRGFTRWKAEFEQSRTEIRAA